MFKVVVDLFGAWFFDLVFASEAGRRPNTLNYDKFWGCVRLILS